VLRHRDGRGHGKQGHLEPRRCPVGGIALTYEELELVIRVPACVDAKSVGRERVRTSRHG
jgi:hypothetical protein